MPTYDYYCSTCDSTFEEVKPIDERHDPLSLPCPTCHSVNTLELVMGSPRIVDPIRIGVSKPKPEFKERMQEIKRRLGPKANIDY